MFRAKIKKTLNIKNFTYVDVAKKNKERERKCML